MQKLIALSLVYFSPSAIHPAYSATVAVDCDLGGLIQPQLDLGNSVNFSGTCDEDLLIRTDGTVLDGGTAATSVIQGDLTVESAQQVGLRNLTVKNAVVGDLGQWYFYF